MLRGDVENKGSHKRRGSTALVGFYQWGNGLYFPQLQMIAGRRPARCTKNTKATHDIR